MYSVFLSFNFTGITFTVSSMIFMMAMQIKFSGSEHLASVNNFQYYLTAIKFQLSQCLILTICFVHFLPLT